MVAFAATTFVVTRVMCSVENGSAGQAPQPAGCGRDTGAHSALHAREGAERGAKGLRRPPGPRVPRARVGGSRGSPPPLPAGGAVHGGPAGRSRAGAPRAGPAAPCGDPPGLFALRPPAPAPPRHMPGRHPGAPAASPKTLAPGPRTCAMRVWVCACACVCARGWRPFPSLSISWRLSRSVVEDGWKKSQKTESHPHSE